MAFNKQFNQGYYWPKGALIGLVIGMLISFNNMFIGLGGEFIYNISLGFLLDSMNFSEGMGWIMGILFFMLVYAIYGTLIGLFISKIKSR